MKLLYKYYCFALAALILLISFQNCSPLSFSDTKQASLLSSLSTNGITINKNALFTNDIHTLIQINVDNAMDMYITNTPGCSSGGVWQPASRETPWVLSEKNNLVTVYAKFRANLQSETPCINASIIHDDIPPLLILREALPVKTKNPTSSIKLNMTDFGSGIDKLVCPVEISPCTIDMIINNGADGIKIFDFYALDKAGNKSAILSTSWFFDKTAPQIRFVTTPASKTNLITANFLVSASDNYSPTNVIKFKCLVNAESYRDCGSNFDFSNLIDGLQTVKVYAYDELENTSNPITYSWTIGRKIPSIKYSETPKPSTNAKSKFAFEGADQFGIALTLFQCSLNDSTFTACNSPFVLTTLIEGENKFKIKAVDSLGLESGELEYKWVYDTKLPIVTWVTYPAEFSKNKNELIKISVSEDILQIESIEFILDNISLVKSLADSTNLSALTEGFHTISVYVTDKAGNISTLSSKTFWSDFTPPTLSYQPVPTPTKNTSLSLIVTARDNPTANNTVSLFYLLDDLTVAPVVPPPATPFTSPLLISNLTHGSHQIKMYAVDKAGNQSIFYLTNQFLTDLIPPVITFVQQPSSEIGKSSQVTIEYLVQDIDSGLKSVYCKFSDSKKIISSGLCAEKATISLPIFSLETYIFEISAVDKVDNPTSVKSITWKTGDFFELKTQMFNVSTQNNNKVDILLVIDNSWSMDTEQLAISAAFENFLTNLGSIDYRIAITTTDVFNSGRGAKGAILPFGGTNLTYIEPTTTDGLALLQETVHTGTDGDGDERGLTAINMFIDLALNSTTEEYKFLRTDAVFASIVVTDADENKDGNGFVDANSFLTEFYKKLSTNKTYIHHSSIILPNDSDTCKATGETVGASYFELSKITGGMSASLCDGTYVNQLKNFATSIINKIYEQNLPCVPVDINNDGKIDIDISYSTSSGTTGKVTDYMVIDKKIKFTVPLMILGSYTITYSCLKPTTP